MSNSAFLIKNCHGTIIRQCPIYSRLVSSIQSGCFQHRYKLGIQCSRSKNLIDQFSTLSNAALCLNKSLFDDTFSVTVYRAMWDIPDLVQSLDHPTPFSTTLSLNFALQWLTLRSQCIVLVFSLKRHHPFVVLDEESEEEIVLAPGVLSIESVYVVDDIRFAKCSYTPHN